MPTTAIELSFDPGSEGNLTGLWTSLGALVAGSGTSALGLRPHVSLAVFRDQVPACVGDFVRQLPAEWTGLTVSLGSPATFHTSEGVVFLQVELSDPLRAVHERVMERLGAEVGCVEWWTIAQAAGRFRGNG